MIVSREINMYVIKDFFNMLELLNSAESKNKMLIRATSKF